MSNDNFRSKFFNNMDELHGAAVPMDIRLHDGIGAKIRIRGQGVEFAAARVWRTSERAVELIVENQELVAGVSVDLELMISGQRLYYEGLIVNDELSEKGIKRIGIRYARQVTRWSETERRASPRWLCEEYCQPVVLVSSPFVMGRPTFMRIKDISSGGMNLITSIKETFLVPKLRIKALIDLPTIGDFQANLEVTRIDFEKERGEDMLSVGVRFVELENANKKKLAQYLIEYSSAISLKELKSSGFNPPSPKKGVTYYFAKSESDIRQIMALRYKAHLAAENFLEDDRDVAGFSLADEIDEHCRLAVGVYDDKVVATARVHFGSLDRPLEHEGYVDWSDELPRRDQVFEISRLAIDPDFQSGDLILGMFQFIGTTCVRPAQPWVVISSWEHMVKKYERIGFKRTGKKHKESQWAHDEEMMIMNSLDVMFGKGVDPFAWNHVWREVAIAAVQSKIVTPLGRNKYRYDIYKALGKAMFILDSFRS